jgi:hypothetical protein
MVAESSNSEFQKRNLQFFPSQSSKNFTRHEKATLQVRVSALSSHLFSSELCGIVFGTRDAYD